MKQMAYLRAPSETQHQLQRDQSIQNTERKRSACRRGAKIPSRLKKKKKSPEKIILGGTNHPCERASRLHSPAETVNKMRLNLPLLLLLLLLSLCYFFFIFGRDEGAASLPRCSWDLIRPLRWIVFTVLGTHTHTHTPFSAWKAAILGNIWNLFTGAGQKSGKINR